MEAQPAVLKQNESEGNAFAYPKNVGGIQPSEGVAEPVLGAPGIFA